MKPLSNIVFTLTGFRDTNNKKQIEKIIILLGGIIHINITTETNILVYEKNLFTEKYKFCARSKFNIIFLNYKSLLLIYNNRNTLINNGNNKLQNLNYIKSNYPHLPLKNFIIFLGRISNTSYTTDQLKDISTKLGCNNFTSQSFNKDCKYLFPNHTIIFLSDLDNFNSGRRIKAAKDLNIPIVHYKWLIDSYKRRAILNFEKYYTIDTDTNISSDIGKDSCTCWNEIKLYEDSLQKQSNTNKNLTYNTNNEPLKKKKDIANETKFKKLYDNILDNNNTNDPSRDSIPDLSNAIPLLPVFNSMDNHKSIIDNNDDASSSSLFNTSQFIIHDSFPTKNKSILINVITNNNGTIINSIEGINPNLTNINIFLIIPSTFEYKNLHSNLPSNIHIVTEFFIERCLHYSKFIFPPDLWSKPFLYSKDFKILSQSKEDTSTSSHINIAISGFNGVELLHITKILKILNSNNIGINFSKYLNKSTDILLTNLPCFPSIPKNHQLWNNDYQSLFTNHHSKEQSFIFNEISRNSLKKKIEFIKLNHRIPAITPGFIFNIFEKSKKNILNLSSSLSSHSFININNKNWCIICPYTNNDNYKYKIISTILPVNNCIKNSGIETLEKFNKFSDQTSNHNYHNNTDKRKRLYSEFNSDSNLNNTNPTKKLLNSPMKLNTKKNSHSPNKSIMKKINYSDFTDTNSHRISPDKNINTSSASSLNVSKPIPHTPSKHSPLNNKLQRTNLNMKLKLNRTPSWGKVMSDTVDSNMKLQTNDELHNLSKKREASKFNDYFNNTEITYGTSPRKQLD